jgi:hypothetical protein
MLIGGRASAAWLLVGIVWLLLGATARPAGAGVVSATWDAPSTTCRPNEPCPSTSPGNVRAATGSDESTALKADGRSTPPGTAPQGGASSGASPAGDPAQQREIALFEGPVIPAPLVLSLFGGALDADRSLGLGDPREAFTSGTLLSSSISGRTFTNFNTDFSVLAGGRKEVEAWSSGAPYTLGGYDGSNLRGNSLIETVLIEEGVGSAIDQKPDHFKIDFLLNTYGVPVLAGLVLGTVMLIGLIGAQWLRRRRPG